MEAVYREVIALVEHMHRQFLDVVKLELDTQGLQDINNVQALMLFSIGDFEVTMGEVSLRGGHLASHATYNVKKMVEAGYLQQERSPHDRRSLRVHLTDKGAALRKKVAFMHQVHLTALRRRSVTTEDLAAAQRTLRRLDRLWSQILDLSQRALQTSTAA